MILYVAIFRSTGSGDFLGQCRLLAALGGHNSIPKRITAIAHVDAPYLATITNEGRVVVWIISDARVVVDSAGRSPLHYDTHFDSQVTQLNGDIEPYTHVAWSPYARSGKGLRLMCAGRGFIDIYSLPCIGGVRTRDTKGAPFYWKNIGRLTFVNDSQLVGLHAVPFPNKSSHILVTTVTNNRIATWCLPHGSWNGDDKTSSRSVITNEIYHSIDITNGLCSTSHALPPLRATTLKDVNDTNTTSALASGSGSGNGNRTDVKDTPFVFATSTSLQAKTKRVARTVSGAFIIIGLVSGAIRIIEVCAANKHYTLHE
jgi:hypothetical protein